MASSPDGHWSPRSGVWDDLLASAREAGTVEAGTVTGEEAAPGFLVPPSLGDQIVGWLGQNQVIQAQRPGSYLEASSQPLIARKEAMYLAVPNELAMEYGLIPDTRPQQPPVRRPLRERLRIRAAPFRERLGARVYRLITGFDVPEYEDD